ncbi:FadR/GntR family transcriptional regulator [Paenibacillus humicola]|uniref:FadR/GntR family transcriptional regulator n=1 Tax=Paenibacillus humicola TaxID=3110540 RepID=UPI00237B77F4|nr:FadR/GntR family transcriptional regulator [Paenibacillus humicola]
MKPIPRTNRKFEDVLLRIRDEIVQSNLQPGDKLMPEREMSEALQVSRTSVREALRILEFFDVIQSKPGEGTTLRKPNIANLLANFYPFFLLPASTNIELLEARKVLEGGIAVLAAERRTTAHIERMQAALEGLLSDDLDVQIQSDLDFHQAMSDAAGNKTLSDILFVVSDVFEKNLQSNRLHLFKMPGAKETLYNLHAAVIRGIIDGDAGKAKAALEQSLDYAIERINQSGFHRTSGHRRDAKRS